MANITLSVSDDLKKEMESLPDVNWSEAVREFLSEKVRRAALLTKLDKLLARSELTEKDVLDLSRKARRGRFKELKAKGLV